MTEPEDAYSLAEKVYSSLAYKIYGRLELLSVNFFVFSRNYHELKRLLHLTKSTKMILRLWDLKNRNELSAVTKDITRLLHNYLAAAKTLVDHTRALVSEWYAESDFLSEYEAQVLSRFTENPISGFIEGLRNYSLHYSLPFTQASMKITSSDGQKLDQVVSEFVLRRSILRYWSNWPAKARSYLDESEDEIPVESLADLYYQKILEFHVWIDKRLRKIHSDELVWLSQMNERIISLMPEDEKRERGLL
ncbi:MAG: hypothetical protein QY332_08460 [Anaerolineales bacterium]|nr:MAG: hypothetical protein QY332_08460 [Anaerolineales bacterium]